MIPHSRSVGRTALRTALLLSLLGMLACEETVEERARDAAEKAQESIQSKATRALEQKASAEEVTQAQEALTIAKEYMGEVNGKLDAVTVNSIQAFQRAHGLEDDGILDAETKKLLGQVRKSETP